ncbi:small-conductance mechanosensitive channel [Levilactobacillus spicheri DSM 15429]|uniref:Mechanosensitive ion channel protein MscS n=2 Tax=Levilactobacillus spicheri TaxID=216463 RepID=A0ABQ0WLT2_9LACO|nr:mechanosensitive ion channel domain-containing protein [Levilactobacillus spicheri]KRL46578.1 small-conductance mechanosensitive channel [Levilactobacillus spicheri DSM 15429]GEO65951.1 mechanosensitive ion channel protein MscS [Levilactobacillus spicheri]
MTIQALVTTTATSTKWFQHYIQSFNWESFFHLVTTRFLNLVALTVLFFLINLIGKAILSRSFKKYLASRDQTSNRLQTISMLTMNLFHYTVLFFWVYALLSTLGVPVGTLVAGAGIFSLALGLGAQGFVSDLVTGISILVEQQFDVGDAVKIGTIEGTVTALGLRTTQVTSADGTVNYIPNRNITIIANRSRNNMRALVNIPIATSTPVEQLPAIIERVNEQLVPAHPSIIEDPVLTGVVTLPSGELVYQVGLIAKNGSQFNLQATFLTAYLKAIRQAGITLPTHAMTTPKA